MSHDKLCPAYDFARLGNETELPKESKDTESPAADEKRSVAGKSSGGSHAEMDSDDEVVTDDDEGSELAASCRAEE